MCVLNETLNAAESLAGAIEARIHQAVVSAAEFLPSQGPITAFTFLNPLAGLEHLSYDEALRQVPEIFGCEPYLPESSYRKMLKQGRLVEGDLRDILRSELSYAADETIAGLISRLDFRVGVLLNSVLSGDDEMTLAVMAAGGDGIISVISNATPKLMTRLTALAAKGDFASAREIHFKLLPWMRAAFIESNPIPVKAAMAMLGKMGNHFRLPLVPLAPQYEETVRAALRAAGALA